MFFVQRSFLVLLRRTIGSEILRFTRLASRAPDNSFPLSSKNPTSLGQRYKGVLPRLRCLLSQDGHHIAARVRSFPCLSCGIRYFLGLFHIRSRGHLFDNALQHLERKVLVLVSGELWAVHDAADNALAHMGLADGISTM